MFHDIDESRIKRNTNDLAFPTCRPKQPDFVEMVWKNNTPVMQKSHRPASSSGFSDFFDNITRFDSENANPRAVPESHNIYGLLPATTTGNAIKYFSNKRSSEERDQEAIQIVENNSKKKLKTMVQLQGDSLVPDNTPISGSMEQHMMRRKTIEFNDHLVPGPDMSIAASNDAPPPCTSHTSIYQDSDSSTYLEIQQWSDEDEDQESARRRRNDRRNRSSLIHTRSEKKRRDRINKKMRALQVLLPNTNKVVDKASVLDEAIDYVKSLQLQLQLMSSGTHMFPMMMPQIQMNQFSAAAAATMGLGGMAPHQFPISPMHHGFPQMLSCFPYMPFFGGTSSVPVVQAETTSVDQIGSNPPPMSGSNHLSYPNDFSQIGFESEVRQQ